MIYDYYCVDCGRKIKGERIAFDLAQLLEMNLGKSSESRMALISAQKLQEIAQKCGKHLEDQVAVKLEVSLKEMLDIMAEYSRRRNYIHILPDMSDHYQLSENVRKLFSGATQSEAQIMQMAADYTVELESRFVFRGNPRMEPTEKELADNNNYSAYFWIKPYMLGEGQIYTVQYRASTQEENTPPVTLQDIRLNTEIRGYCPECGKPVLLHTGQVPHIMVGLLGAQSAGKTSLIVSMISYIQNNYDTLGIEYPGNPLCDSKYRYMMRNLKLFEYGWAMEKTVADVATETFNASLFLSPKIDGRKPQGQNMAEGSSILTLIDIAGEACFDMETQTWKENAFEVYPLIRNCQIYLLCTCINRREYGNADGTDAFSIPNRAVMQIADQVYQALPSSRVPPICIVATKADTMPETASPYRPGDQNPFKTIQVDEKYLYKKTQMEYLINDYDRGSEDNREPLRGCCRAYDLLKNRTYISMMAVSALGRKGQKYPYEGEVSQYSEDGDFFPNQIDALTKWVLMTAGISRVEGTSYLFSHIPSYGESYVLKGQKTKPEAIPSKCYPIVEFTQRYNCVKKLFLNSQVDLDRRINSIFMEGRRMFGPSPESRIAKEIEKFEQRG